MLGIAITTRKQIRITCLIYFLIFGLGITFGWLFFLLFGDFSSQCNVVLVSKAALLELENKRVKLADGSFDSKDMFFGDQERFLDLVISYSSTFRDKKTKVLIVSDNSGNSYGGENITKVVYDAVAKKMHNEKITNSNWKK